MRFSVVTFGCSFNKHDSELIINILNKKYEYTSVEKAEIVIINTCTVKNLAETKAFRLLRKLKESGKKVIFCGCIPQAEPALLKDKLKDISVVGPYAINKIDEAVKATLDGKVYHNLKNENLNRLKCAFSLNKITKIVPISDGCLGSCTYCKTRFARGRLKSFPIKEIVNSIREAVQEGYKEILITSQDVACYGKDIGTSLTELMEEITKIQGDFFVRIGMGNPRFFADYFEEFLELLKNPIFYKFIHIPIQSGSNKILKMMNRNYRKEEYIKLIEKARASIPNITISTDLIVAFPGESESDFEESLNLIKTTKPDILNLSRFWLRPGTPAEKFKKFMIDGKESKLRSKKVKELFNKISLEKNKQWIGWQGRVLVTEKGKAETYIARNIYYKQVILQGEYSKGEWLNVRITDSSPFDLKGMVINKLNK